MQKFLKRDLEEGKGGGGCGIASARSPEDLSFTLGLGSRPGPAPLTLGMDTLPSRSGSPGFQVRDQSHRLASEEFTVQLQVVTALSSFPTLCPDSVGVAACLREKQQRGLWRVKSLLCSTYLSLCCPCFQKTEAPEAVSPGGPSG